jgi:outer membrane protein
LRPTILLFFAAVICCAPNGTALAAAHYAPPDRRIEYNIDEPVLSSSAPCSRSNLVAEPLALEEAIERSLCHDPALRQAYSNAQLRAAQLGQRRSAYFPRIDGEGIQSWRRSKAEDSGAPETIRANSQTRSGALNLSWVLLDSGRREAALEATRHLLTAAHADQNGALQSAFLDAAQLYFAVQAAARRLMAAEQVLALASTNWVAANERYRAGAAALADSLQAQAAYTQASLRRSRERGALAVAQGTLALRMGISANAPITVETSESHLHARDYLRHVEELIAVAIQTHPVLIAARARMAAAEATVVETQAAGRPTLAIVGSLTQARSRLSGANGSGTNRVDNTIGLQLSIPIFRGFEHTYQVKEARAQVALNAAELTAHRQRISIDVWTQHARLNMESENLMHTLRLVEQTLQSLEIIQGRYQAGVGTMTDVLNAMNAYASAREQHIEAVQNWQVSRLSLAGSLGRLGFWDLTSASN